MRKCTCNSAARDHFIRKFTCDGTPQNNFIRKFAYDGTPQANFARKFTYDCSSGALGGSGQLWEALGSSNALGGSGTLWDDSKCAAARFGKSSAIFFVLEFFLKFSENRIFGADRGQGHFEQCIHTSTHPHVHTSTHPHIHTSIHPHIHTSTHPHIHTYTLIFRPSHYIRIPFDSSFAQEGTPRIQHKFESKGTSI